MFHFNNFEYKTSVPFVRWLLPRTSEHSAKVIGGSRYLPELLLTLSLYLTFNSWVHATQNLGSFVIFIFWAFIVLILFTLALANAKTYLLPTVMLKPLIVLVIAFQILIAQHTSDIRVLGSAILGALILGGIPYLLFQISAGKWIGGGDVRLGFIAGLLLGWKVGLFCLGVIVSLILVMFFGEYLEAKFSKSHKSPVIPTGVTWVTAIMISVLIGQRLLS